MITRKFTGVLILSIIALSIFRCKPQEILLHGDITGVVTDAATSQPIQGASAELISTNDSTGTRNDGSFLFKNLTPGPYEIKASKYGYDSIIKNIEVISAETNQIAISLNGIPVPKPSVSFLDFGIDSTSLRFTISNLGKGKFSYVIYTSQDWITVSPLTGNITDSLKIKVTINRSGLSENIYNETITIFTAVNQVPLPGIVIPVTLNGVRDHDGNYYKVVRIGSQIWMAENLNVGTVIPIDKSPDKNGIIEKYCYADLKTNCDIYGGLYRWDEMMQYTPADTGLISTTQGICPVGWHIPSQKEWSVLAENVGGVDVAGSSLKEAGFSHWSAPNLGATNESGFTGLPGGIYSPPPGYIGYDGLGNYTSWWTSEEYYLKNSAYWIGLDYNIKSLDAGLNATVWGLSVRCVKNPGKK
jgi:uncharacterized protein (TIGR02145 family)